MRVLLNKFVRFYLMYFPITEGKKQLLQLTKDFITPGDPILIFKTKYNFYLRVNLQNPEHKRMYFYGEHDERYEIRHILKTLREEDICWDIGANVGFYTCLFASLVGKKGRVVSFEPASGTMDYLAQNVKINGLDQVTLIKKAVGDRKIEGKLFYNAGALAEGTASLTQSIEKAESEPIEVDTIESFAQELPAPDFIKIDVEGFQMEVFKGGKEFFKSHEPIIMAELKDDNADVVHEMESYIRNLGYSIYEFRKSALHKCLSIVQAKKRNFLLIKESSAYFSRIKHRVSLG